MLFNKGFTGVLPKQIFVSTIFIDLIDIPETLLQYKGVENLERNQPTG